jgi:lipoate---protein ligase
VAEPRLDAVESSRGWTLEWRSGSAEELHAAQPSAEAGPTLWICRVDRPALVLGSIQRDLVITPAVLQRAGLDLVRRRSGGGAVLLDPGGSVWVDLIIPKGHRLWDDDVGRATHWVGRSWVDALASLGISASEHRGPMRRNEWSSLVCFAGLGPGEVVDPSGHKLVGISQRRTRHTARFQTVAYHRGDPGDVVDALDLSEPDALAATAAVRATARALDVGPDVGHDDIVEALVTALPLG